MGTGGKGSAKQTDGRLGAAGGGPGWEGGQAGVRAAGRGWREGGAAGRQRHGRRPQAVAGDSPARRDSAAAGGVAERRSAGRLGGARVAPSLDRRRCWR